MTATDSHNYNSQILKTIISDQKKGEPPGGSSPTYLSSILIMISFLRFRFRHLIFIITLFAFLSFPLINNLSDGRNRKAVPVSQLFHRTSLTVF